MKKAINLWTVFLFVFSFTNCSDKDKETVIYHFYDEPAVLETLGTNSVIRTPHGKFVVSSLEDNSLKQGALLWTAFTVDMNDKIPEAATEQYRASAFQYKEVDSAKVILPADPIEFNSCLSDDYSAFIYEAVLYKDYIDSLLFFGFQREVHSNKLMFRYEIIRNPEIENPNGYPTFYIRSKKMDLTVEHTGSQETVFAFDMAEFIREYRKEVSANSPVKFILKYKTGVNEDGKDIYRDFRSNPIAWEIIK
jgi:hypothetical protein